MPSKGLGRLAAMVAGMASIVMGQTTTGAITGTITDPSGAAVPSVKVTAANTATNVSNTTQSNAAGVFNFPFLPIGEYTLTAEAQGFYGRGARRYASGLAATAAMSL